MHFSGNAFPGWWHFPPESLHTFGDSVMPSLRSFARRLLAPQPTATIRRPALGLQQLETREVPAIDLIDGVITVTGNNFNDTVTVASRQSRGGGFDITVTHSGARFLPLFGYTPFTDTRTFNTAADDLVGIHAELGNANNSFVNGTNLPSTVNGGTGLDVMNGGTRRDEFHGGGGADVLRGGLGNDVLFGGGGSDLLDGGSGDDYILAADGDDEIRAGDGNDEANGGGGHDFMHGDAGNDLLQGGGGNDELNGGAGNDTLDGGNGDDVLAGLDGDDELIGGIGNDTLRGDAGADDLAGGEGNDTLVGGTGNDTLADDAGNGFLSGGAGNDFIDASNADGAYIDGGDGHDTIRGTYHADTIYGGGGDDFIQGGNGQDFIFGEGGNDAVYGYYRTPALESDTDAGNVLNGGSGDDTLVGFTGSDQLTGGGGNDKLFGHAGNDQLSGGAGLDRLFGGAGLDTLVGGSGSDRFLQREGAQADFILDKSAVDVTTVFVDSPDGYKRSDGEEYDWAYWDDERVLAADRALAVLHETMGDATFLRRDGDDLRIRITGDFVRGSGEGSDALGWNNDSDTISLISDCFGNPVLAAEVVLHEIGHYWDESNRNASVGDFRALSGWSSDTGLADTPGYSLSRDGDWVHLTAARFTRDYGRENPREDFAECFGLYWLHQMGEESVLADNQFDDLTGKMNYMAGFVADMQ